MLRRMRRCKLGPERRSLLSITTLRRVTRTDHLIVQRCHQEQLDAVV